MARSVILLVLDLFLTFRVVALIYTHASILTDSMTVLRKIQAIRVLRVNGSVQYTADSQKNFVWAKTHIS